MSRRERGSSRLPVNTAGNLWIEEGVKFFERREDGPRKLPERLKYLSTLHAIVEAYRTGEEAYGRTKNRKNPDGDPGVLFSDIVNELWTNPTAVSDWHDERDEEAAKRLRAFRALCGRIAGEFSQLYPGVEMKVDVNPKEKKVRSKKEAEQNDKRYEEVESSRIIYAEWLDRVQAGEGREKAKEKVAYRRGISVTRVREAIAFCRKTNGNAA
jgi:hypothetical protein